MNALEETAEKITDRYLLNELIDVSFGYPHNIDRESDGWLIGPTKSGR